MTKIGSQGTATHFAILRAQSVLMARLFRPTTHADAQQGQAALAHRFGFQARVAASYALEGMNEAAGTRLIEQLTAAATAPGCSDLHRGAKATS